jgi:hypothetical protein
VLVITSSPISEVGQIDVSGGTGDAGSTGHNDKGGAGSDGVFGWENSSWSAARTGALLHTRARCLIGIFMKHEFHRYLYEFI